LNHRSIFSGRVHLEVHQEVHRAHSAPLSHGEDGLVVKDGLETCGEGELVVKDGPETCGEGGLVVKDGLDTYGKDDLAVRWSCGRDEPFTSLVVPSGDSTQPVVETMVAPS